MHFDGKMKNNRGKIERGLGILPYGNSTTQTIEKENALINHYIKGVSCTFRKSKKLWILHIKKTQCSKAFFRVFIL